MKFREAKRVIPPLIDPDWNEYRKIDGVWYEINRHGGENWEASEETVMEMILDWGFRIDS